MPWYSAALFNVHVDAGVGADLFFSLTPGSSFKTSKSACGAYTTGRFIYKVDRAPMCDYLMQFVHKLREQSTLESMNRVLENFTSVVLVRDRMTTQILFCAVSTHCCESLKRGPCLFFCAGI